jgi:hypothetical protein
MLNFFFIQPTFFFFLMDTYIRCMSTYYSNKCSSSYSSSTFDVTVVDNEASIIKFNGAGIITHNAYTEYTDENASATDNCGTPNVSIGGNEAEVIIPLFTTVLGDMFIAFCDSNDHANLKFNVPEGIGAATITI